MLDEKGNLTLRLRVRRAGWPLMVVFGGPPSTGGATVNDRICAVGHVAVGSAKQSKRSAIQW